MKFYLDTSILGGLFDKEFDRPTRELFDFTKRKGIKIIYSEILGKELELAPEHIKIEAKKTLLKAKAEYIEVITGEMLNLADKYIEVGALTKKSINDAQHIAIATVAGASAIISWNFRHMVNFIKIQQYNFVNFQEGYKMISIYSPMAIIES
jgi:predicted nucleic acid-binding protein